MRYIPFIASGEDRETMPRLAGKEMAIFSTEEECWEWICKNIMNFEPEEIDAGVYPFPVC